MYEAMKLLLIALLVGVVTGTRKTHRSKQRSLRSVLQTETSVVAATFCTDLGGYCADEKLDNTCGWPTGDRFGICVDQAQASVHGSVLKYHDANNKAFKNMRVCTGSKVCSIPNVILRDACADDHKSCMLPGGNGQYTRLVTGILMYRQRMDISLMRQGYWDPDLTPGHEQLTHDNGVYIHYNFKYHHLTTIISAESKTVGEMAKLPGYDPADLPLAITGELETAKTYLADNVGELQEVFGENAATYLTWALDEAHARGGLADVKTMEVLMGRARTLIREEKLTLYGRQTGGGKANKVGDHVFNQDGTMFPKLKNWFGDPKYGPPMHMDAGDGPALKNKIQEDSALVIQTSAKTWQVSPDGTDIEVNGKDKEWNAHVEPFGSFEGSITNDKILHASIEEKQAYYLVTLLVHQAVKTDMLAAIRYMSGDRKLTQGLNRERAGGLPEFGSLTNMFDELVHDLARLAHHLAVHGTFGRQFF